MRRMKLIKGQNKPKITLDGRLLLRKPRLYQSCSTEKEEDSEEVPI
jgi:hypothetical protein